MKLSWSEAESKAQDVAEYRRRPVLRQELKGKKKKTACTAPGASKLIFKSHTEVLLLQAQYRIRVKQIVFKNQ